MGAIRFHIYDNEARAIRRQERAFAPEGNDEGTTDAVSDGENDPADLEAAEDKRLFCAYMAELRSLQNAGIISHNLKCFPPLANDPYAEFANA